MGNAISALVNLANGNYSSLNDFVGTLVRAAVNLSKGNYVSLSRFVGNAVDALVNLFRGNYYSLSDFIGSAISVVTNLTNSGSNWTSGLMSWLTGNRYGTVEMVVNLVAGVVRGFQAIFGKAEGGIVTAAGRSLSFARGGVIRGSGRAGWWDSVNKYASGTSRAHGTVFVAGEAGPEVVGHVNGRTEILNKSQLAQAIYGAVTSGMGQAVNALGRYLAGHMSRCADAISATVAANGVGDLRGLEYYAPAMSAGAVLPYAVNAQADGPDDGLRSVLDANNEDLIQTIISVIGAQTSAIVSALNAIQRQAGAAAGPSAQQIIDDINRRAQMFGESPILI